MPRKRAKPVFSAAKAVRANARERVGQPKAARVIVERKPAGSRESKQKETLAGLLDQREE